MGKTVYLSKDEERLIQRALGTQMLNEYDRDNIEKGDEYQELSNKIAQTPLK